MPIYDLKHCLSISRLWGGGRLMTTKNKLQIYLITYNRKVPLTRTLEQIFAENSPIRDFDITILDNASTDGSSDLIDEYCKKFTNLKHIKHKVNIGGNANYVRVVEMSASCGKEYAWVLCDDDIFDFSNFNELEQRIEAKDDIICVADYIFKDSKDRQNPACQVVQFSFVPAVIYKTAYVTNEILINMYDSILIMFPQLVLCIKCMNEGKKISVLSHFLVLNGYDGKVNVSYHRGNDKRWNLERRNKQNWILGFTQILTLFDDVNLRKEAVEYAINNKCIYRQSHQFYRDVFSNMINLKYFNYFYEIFRCLKFKNKIIFFCLIPSYFIYFYTTSKDTRLYLFGLKIKIFPKVLFGNATGGGGG